MRKGYVALVIFVVSLSLVASGVSIQAVNTVMRLLDNNTIEDKRDVVKVNTDIVSIYKAILDINETQIDLVRNKIEIAKAINSISEASGKESVKPSYDYLKAVTVYIQGEILPVRTELGTTVLGEAWTGTGTVIKQSGKHSYVLTNGHVAGKNKPGEKILKIILEDREAEAMVFSYHEEYDLAILLVFDPLAEKQTIKGVNTEIKPSDKVYSVGNYLGLKDIYTEGTFAGYYGGFYDFNLPTAFGCSGSGVFDNNGDMVAVVFAIHGVGFMGVDTAKAITVPGKVVQEYISWLGY